MDCNDKMVRRITGEVTLLFCHRGRVIDSVGANTITDVAYDVISDWAAQDFSDVVAEIAVGDGGNVPGDPFTPIPATEADAALVNELDRKAVATISKLGSNITEYVTSFLPGEGVGQLTEVGLFTTTNRMFARHTFGVKVKNGTTLIVRWKVTF